MTVQMRQAEALPPDWLDDVVATLRDGKAVRRDFGEGERLHIDRPLPFLCVHLLKGRDDEAARDVAAAHASYLIVRDAEAALPIVKAIGAALEARFGAMFLMVLDELKHDALLSDDAPSLPPFEIRIAATQEPAARKAAEALAQGVVRKDIKYRTARILHVAVGDEPDAKRLAAETGYPTVFLAFAPIYRQAGSGRVFPDLRERLTANVFDAGLKAFAAFVESATDIRLATHRALGRKAFADAVARADRSMDDVSRSFDFLFAVTPINADAAWRDFKAGDFRKAPHFLYRPLSVQVETEKRKLFSIAFDRFDDPVLYHLYREKQQELDLQLSMMSARETPRFVELSRALYGRVEPQLLAAARHILRETAGQAGDNDDGDGEDSIGEREIEAAARRMIEDYKSAYDGFDATVVMRDDLPPGMMVSTGKLFVSTATRMPAGRLEALLNHEIGVHLLTYVNGATQGLRLFRSGLAGYEGMQEGLAVFSEYMVGGMTVGRLRLIAARVVGCAAMLDGASFSETFAILTREHGFTETGAFHLTLRLYRGGGLAKDAIYLRGLLELLGHLKTGGALDPFWMGKISADHFRVMQELGLRGLLKPPAIRPFFLVHQQAEARLARARQGLTPLDLVTLQE